MSLALLDGLASQSENEKEIHDSYWVINNTKLKEYLIAGLRLQGQTPISALKVRMKIKVR